MLTEREASVFTNRRGLHLPQPAPDLTVLGRRRDATTPAIGPGLEEVAARPTRRSRTWYDPERFARLMAAYIAHDRDSGRERTVREFVAEFDGLTGTAKQTKVLDATGLSCADLSSLVAGDEIDAAAAGRLLAAMKAHSRPVKPKRSGRHRRGRTAAALRGPRLSAGELHSTSKRRGETDGVPWFRRRPSATVRRPRGGGSSPGSTGRPASSTPSASWGGSGEPRQRV